MRTDNDRRIVVTLDAGGTNFVFSAIQANQEIVEPLTLPSGGHDLATCLRTIVDGFAHLSRTPTCWSSRRGSHGLNTEKNGQ